MTKVIIEQVHIIAIVRTVAFVHNNMCLTLCEYIAQYVLTLR